MTLGVLSQGLNKKIQRCPLAKQIEMVQRAACHHKYAFAFQQMRRRMWPMGSARSVTLSSRIGPSIATAPSKLAFVLRDIALLRRVL
jgi:hypothetical protein